MLTLTALSSALFSKFANGGRCETSSSSSTAPANANGGLRHAAQVCDIA